MTHRLLEFEPGPRVNLIVGPNGTGKSSVVCGIALALGGSPKHLGRVDAEGKFVRRGARTAEVEVELEGGVGRPRVVFRRVIQAEDDSSQFWVDGVRVAPREVHKRVAQINVEVSSLLSFLAQDRVSLFPALSRRQLLEEVQAASGMPELLEHHQRLAELASEARELDTSVMTRRRHLDQLVEQNRALEKTVKRAEKRTRHLELAAAMEQKLPHLRADEKAAEYNVAKADLDAMQAELKNLDASVVPLRKALQKATAEKAEAAEAVTRAKAEITKASRAEETAHDAVERCMDAYVDACKALKDEGKRRKELERDHEATREAIEGLKRDLEKLDSGGGQQARDPKALEAQIAKLTAELTGARARSADAADQMKACDDEIYELGRQINAKARLLNSEGALVGSRIRDLEGFSGENLRAVWEYIKNNQGLFKMPAHVVGPIGAEMTGNSRLHGSYLSHILPINTLMTFVVGCREDQVLLIRELREKRGLRVMVTLVRGGARGRGAADDEADFDEAGYLEATERRLAEVRQKIDREGRAVGVTGMLIDTFKAKPIVKKALEELHNLNAVACGTALTDEVSNTTRARKLFPTVITPSGATTSFRNYTAEKDISRTEALKWREDLAFFNKGTTGGAGADDPGAVAAQIAELEARVTAKRAAKERIDNETKDVRNSVVRMTMDRAKLQEALQARARLQGALAMKQSSLAQLAKKVAEFAPNQQLQARVIASLGSMMAASEAYAAAAAHLAAATMQAPAAAGRKNLAVSALQAAEFAVKNEEERQVDLKNMVKVCESRITKLKAEWKRLAEEAKKVPLTPELEARFAEFPDTVDELEAAIAREKAHAAAIFETTPDAIRDYEERAKVILGLERTLGKDEDKSKGLHHEIGLLKDLWLGPVGALIATVSEAFTKYFAAAGCAGEVRLYRPDDELDFAQYGLDILVKFRADDPLQLLSGAQQSGGEKSLSTMLFLLSLQDVTQTPFRVVDEINQGLDAHFEEKVFHVLGKYITGATSPQYFIITPKLLTGLNYAEHITVFMIYNGGGIDLPTGPHAGDPDSLVEMLTQQG
jgi:chromosome segregation ATPase